MAPILLASVAHILGGACIETRIQRIWSIYGWTLVIIYISSSLPHSHPEPSKLCRPGRILGRGFRVAQVSITSSIWAEDECAHRKEWPSLIMWLASNDPINWVLAIPRGQAGIVAGVNQTSLRKGGPDILPHRPGGSASRHTAPWPLA